MLPQEESMQVSESALVAQAASLVRNVLSALGGYAVARGLVRAEDLQAALGVVMIVIPAAWGVYSSWKKNREKVKMANQLPDSAAKVVSLGSALRVW